MTEPITIGRSDRALLCRCRRRHRALHFWYDFVYLYAVVLTPFLRSLITIHHNCSYYFLSSVCLFLCLPLLFGIVSGAHVFVALLYWPLVYANMICFCVYDRVAICISCRVIYVYTDSSDLRWNAWEDCHLFLPLHPACSMSPNQLLDALDIYKCQAAAILFEKHFFFRKETTKQRGNDVTETNGHFKIPKSASNIKKIQHISFNLKPTKQTRFTQVHTVSRNRWKAKQPTKIERIFACVLSA